MAYYRKDNKNAQDDYVKQLIQEREKGLKTVFVKTREHLEQIKYFELEKDAKIEFLCSKDGQQLVENCAKNKVSFAEMSGLFGFGQKELHELAKETPEIYDAIDRGRVKEVDEVEQMLNKLAIGYTITEKRERVITDSHERESRQTELNERYIPPNFLAQKYVLETKRALEFQADKAQAEIEKNKIHLEIVVIGEDELNKE